MSPPRLLLVSTTTGYQLQAFSEAAARLGIEIQLATDRCHHLEDPWGDHAIPVRFETAQASAAHAASLAEGVSGIVALGDRPALVAAYLAQLLSLPFHPPAAVAASRNKFLARELFAAAGLPVPAYRTVPLEADPHGEAASTSFPCVLKPLGLSASRGVIRANNEAEFVAAFRRIVKLLECPEIARLHDADDRLIQVERFLPGREFAVEGILTHGKLQVLAIFDKPDPLDGPFFEETIYVTPSRETAEKQRALVDAASRAAAALGLVHGPIHAEMRVNEHGVWVLEAAARPIGGLCARALRFSPGGIGLEELILRHACSEDVSGFQLEEGGAAVMMIPIPAGGVYQGFRGEEAARSVRHVEDLIITAKIGQKLIPLPEGSSYLGFLFARAGDARQAETAVREAHAKLQFEILGALPVLRG